MSTRVLKDTRTDSRTLERKQKHKVVKKIMCFCIFSTIFFWFLLQCLIFLWVYSISLSLFYFFAFIFRIRTEKSGGAWCPKGVVDKDSYEYLQIDLVKLMVITKVEVQGRFGNGIVREYIFRLYFSHFDKKMQLMWQSC